MKSIQWRLVFIYLTLVLIVMISSGTFILWQIQHHEYSKINKELSDMADMIKSAIISEDGSIQSGWKDLSWFWTAALEIKIYILDAEGNIVIPAIEDGSRTVE